MASYLYGGRDKISPYRTGVLIGNYVEEMFGLDLRQKYANTNMGKSINITEHREKYKWPIYSEAQLKSPGNDMTRSCSSNYNLNIDFSRKKPSDFKNLEKVNKFGLTENNSFSPEEMKMSLYRKFLETEKTGLIPKEDANSSTQKALSAIQAKDAAKILESKGTGLQKEFIFSHGDQDEEKKKNMYHGNITTINHLALGKHIPTETFLDPLYEADKNLRYPRKNDIDYYDWGYRKYREYGEFAKKLDLQHKMSS